MNQSQTVFTIFFAIFWGAMANVQSKWKPFQVPLVFSKKPFRRLVLRRVILAFSIFNVIPLIYFGWTMFFLDSIKSTDWDINSVIDVTINGILPAFIVFGLNHLWIAIVERNAECFYAKDQSDLPQNCKRVHKSSYPIDPTIKELGIKHYNWWKNLLAAIFYAIIAIVIPRVWVFLCCFLNNVAIKLLELIF